MTATPYLLHVKRYQPGAKNDRGNKVPGYGPPLPWPVHSIAPGAQGAPRATQEPAEPNRDLSVIVHTVYAPANDKLPGERDRVVYDDVEYDVNGRPGDWSQGAPWAFAGAPATVELKRVEG